MLMLILEAALRSMLMAFAVWAVIRMLRVQAVFAQKIAWVLVLVCAAVMPLVMHTSWLTAKPAVRIPLGGMTRSQLLECLQMLMPRPKAKLPAQAGTVTATATPELGSRVRLTKQDAQPKPLDSREPNARKSIVFHQFYKRVLKDRSTTGNIRVDSGIRVLDLPIFPELSVKLPVALPARASFWTASHIRVAVILLYSAVVVALLLRTIFGLAVAARLLQRSRKVHFFSGTGRTMRVRSSKDLATPVTIGSTILLPADYASWDEEKLRLVLAHEDSHVRQRDFYLQLAATVHAAIFWFSPLGWWLKHKLSDLGEALSDGAALAQAEDAASYAQVLLEFAAAPRRAPLAGVAMARRSNLSTRIERILTDSRFQLAFLGGRRHAILAAVLVPAALIAAVAGFRIVPAVHAASATSITANKPAAVSATVRAFSSGAGVSCAQGPSFAIARTISSEKLQASNAVATSITGGEFVQVAAIAPQTVAPAAPVAPAPEVVPPAAPEPPQDADDDSDDDNQSRHNHAHSRTITHGGDDGDSFSIVHEEANGTHSRTVQVNGDYNDEIAHAQKELNLRGNYIWFEHDGESYVITDPAVIAQADAMFREDPALKRQQKVIEDKQKILEKQMAEFDADKVKIKLDNPEFKKQMAELNAQIAKLQSDEFKKSIADLNKQIDQEALSHIQEQMGNIQSQIGELQGQIGEQMGKYGEQQGPARGTNGPSRRTDGPHRRRARPPRRRSQPQDAVCPGSGSTRRQSEASSITTVHFKSNATAKPQSPSFVQGWAFEHICSRSPAIMPQAAFAFMYL